MVLQHPANLLHSPAPHAQPQVSEINKSSCNCQSMWDRSSIDPSRESSASTSNLCASNGHTQNAYYVTCSYNQSHWREAATAGGRAGWKIYRSRTSLQPIRGATKCMAQHINTPAGLALLCAQVEVTAETRRNSLRYGHPYSIRACTHEKVQARVQNVKTAHKRQSNT